MRFSLPYQKYFTICFANNATCIAKTMRNRKGDVKNQKIDEQEWTKLH